MADNLDGPLIVQWVRRAATGLKDKQAEINRLNVFPIPDSDTGSNMAHTMAQACEYSEEVDASNTAEVTAALASGAVRGARGNSGVVLSQVLRALADTAARGPVNGAAVAAMLRQAGGFVRAAISSPVEGTVISVLDAAAKGAAAGKESLRDSVQRALHAAEEALEHTPEQLPVLAKAGVVDAGGRGLVVILQALNDVLTGEEAPAAAGDSPEGESAHQSHGSAAELEVMFFFTGTEGACEKLRSMLDEHGNSVVIGAVDAEQATVHVHTRHAGTVIQHAFALGTVEDLRIEVLPDQAATEAPEATAPIIALVDSEGAADIFRTAGAAALRVGDSLDTEDAADALAAAGPGPVAVLTNGFDAAELLAAGQPLELINTEALVGGMAALAVHDAGADWDDNLEEMMDAVAAQRWAECAVEDTQSTIMRLLQSGGELVTLLWDAEEAGEELIRSAVANIRETHPDVHVDVYAAPGMGKGHGRVQIGVE
ncbi:MAG TPA: DAK2 domain-containing protein [Candidatus Corynebacterium gallistercoris]|uniref:DAK2 domain-containing protein n=1 Tax=Candidatus Corynebacterium gallistercoris TaxID=2838530 RepID=A0A9D1S1J0_9CORY|nr:DAK2 domain-containing protein [Candidatus Corynebacterium gallistercoris]